MSSPLLRIPVSVVVERVKSPYPSTQDHRYAEALRVQVKELLASGDHEVFRLFDRQWLTTAAGNGAQISETARQVFELVLNFAVWIDLAEPELRLG